MPTKPIDVGADTRRRSDEVKQAAEDLGEVYVLAVAAHVGRLPKALLVRRHYLRVVTVELNPHLVRGTGACLEHP